VALLVLSGREPYRWSGSPSVVRAHSRPSASERAQLDGHERQGLRVDPVPGGGGERAGQPGVVEGRLAGARRRVDQHEPPAGAVAHRVAETGASVDPPRPDLVADDQLARTAGRRRSCSAAW
jgi:hypothetical protein